MANGSGPASNADIDNMDGATGAGSAGSGAAAAHAAGQQGGGRRGNRNRVPNVAQNQQHGGGQPPNVPPNSPQNQGNPPVPQNRNQNQNPPAPPANPPAPPAQPNVDATILGHLTSLSAVATENLRNSLNRGGLQQPVPVTANAHANTEHGGSNMAGGHSTGGGGDGSTFKNVAIGVVLIVLALVFLPAACSNVQNAGQQVNNLPAWLSQQNRGAAQNYAVPMGRSDPGAIPVRPGTERYTSGTCIRSNGAIGRAGLSPDGLPACYRR